MFFFLIRLVLDYWVIPDLNDPSVMIFLVRGQVPDVWVPTNENVPEISVVEIAVIIKVPLKPAAHSKSQQDPAEKIASDTAPSPNFKLAK